MKNKTNQIKYVYVAQFGHFGYSWIVVSTTRKDCFEKCKQASCNKRMPEDYIKSIIKRMEINKIYSVN